MHTDSDVQDQNFEFLDQDSYKSKNQKHNSVTDWFEKIITHLTE